MKTLLAMLVVLVGCGGDDANGDAHGAHVTPKLIAGGGVTDAPITGELHVYVVEIDSATPVSGATVRVEAATPLTATTDATGLASFTGLTGPQIVTATAGGHAAATWFGVAGANVTLPLEPSPHTIPTAHVTGTIAGWNGLAAPAFGHYTLGVVLYSFLDDPGAPENSIVQPTSGGTPLNTCIRSIVSNSCAWEMNARVGKQIHTAVIVDGDAHGTSSDTSDDTYTLIGYAAGSVMTLTSGQQVTNESLATVAATAPFSVTLPAAPAGLPKVVAIPELALGDAGRVVFPLPTLGPGNTSTQVLAATGAFAGSYELVALATPSATAKAPFTSAFAHAASGSATIGAWLAPPAQLMAGASYAFTAAAGAAFHTAQFRRGTAVLWNVSVLDGAASFMLPALSPDPLGSGSATFAVAAADVPGFDANHFDVPGVKTSLARASGAELTFTH
jgi:hypothetical protein